MLLAPLLAVLAAPDAPALGVWTANGARLELSQTDGKVAGRLASAGGPCPVAPGTELLRGKLLDDSLSAQLRLCLMAPQCGASEETALAVLLVTRTLTGGVHTRAACAQDVHSPVLRRPDAAMAMTAPPPTERLSKTPVPKPRAQPAGLSDAKLPISLATGDIPGRPVGDPKHPDGYDPRGARKAGTPRGEAEKLLVEGAADLQRGRFEQAQKLFREAIAKDPQRAEAYNAMGVTFSRAASSPSATFGWPRSTTTRNAN